MSSFESVLDTTAVSWCLIGIIAWLLTAWLHRAFANPTARVALLLPRIIAAFTACFMSLQVTDGLIGTATFLPFWVIGLVAAIVSEVVFWCYSAELTPETRTRRRTPGMAFLMPIPRIVAIGLVAIQLLQPTRSHEEEKREERMVAVVMDTSASMDLPARISPTDSRTRRQIVNELLADTAVNRQGLLATLKQRYKVKLYQMDSAARLRPEQELPAVYAKQIPADEKSSGLARSTDFAAALRRVNGDIPASSLSGVVLLTDGCDHSETNVADAIGFLKANDIPLSSVLIGSPEPIRDAEIVSVQAPSQIYHGDELTLQAFIRADEFAGQVANVQLLEGDEIVEERELHITNDRYRETISFRYEPQEARLHSFRVQLSDLEGDETPENNVANSQVWVSKDRIRVLIVEDRPRWEFRYLRNLFAGRDKSVFLQAVLLRPDRLAGVPDPLVRRASVLRAFDDCNANALPANEAEWLKFDVVILGDVDPKHLGANGVRVLETFVADHGGSLVVVSGANHMPHSYGNTPLRELLPARITNQASVQAVDRQSPIRFRPTADGMNHAVLQRTGMNTERAWQSFPGLSWRHPASEAKIGATVLAYAGDQNVDTDIEQQRQRALMLWHRVGAGKVMQLNFDESWRLRYGIGDRLHHQFWGQIVRWCASDRLSVGTDLVRMGTDRFIYRVGDTVKVRARLLDTQRNPVVNGDVRVVLLRDDEVLQSVELTPDPTKHGLLAGEIRDLNQGGAYRVELAGEQVSRLLQFDSPDAETIGVDIGVKAIATGNEALDVVSDDTVLRQLAGWTGGVVTSSENAGQIPDSMGPQSSFQRRTWTTPLWNTWPVVLTFLSCLSLDWILRKLNGRV